jgi:anaerobic selenocysteine-containing dehydrogenase
MPPRQFTQIQHGVTADRWTTSTCGICSVGCGVEIGVSDGRISDVMLASSGASEEERAYTDRLFDFRSVRHSW